MNRAAPDDALRSLLTSLLKRPCSGLYETAGHWGLDGCTIRISKLYPNFAAGFNWDLGRASRFYKRPFDFPDLGKRGWVIIFQVQPPGEPGHNPAEYICAQVPLEQEHDAQRWIDFLNSEIRDRLAGTREGGQ